MDESETAADCARCLRRA